MNSKQPAIRPLGQRSIPSTFLFRPLNRSNVCKGDEQIKAPNGKSSIVSLSDFLNKKLHRSSVLPGSLEGKTKPFSSPIGGGKATECTKEEVAENGRGEVGTCPAFALEVMLEQFKHTKKEEKDNVIPCSDEEGNVRTDDTQESRKRKHGDNDKRLSGKVLAVLGDDSGTRQRVKLKRSTTDKNPIPLFNHYANGGGWWDDNMEGVDNEEVGCNEIWEGMGCTTLGGLDWH